MLFFGALLNLRACATPLRRRGEVPISKRTLNCAASLSLDAADRHAALETGDHFAQFVSRRRGSCDGVFAIGATGSRREASAAAWAAPMGGQTTP